MALSVACGSAGSPTFPSATPSPRVQRSVDFTPRSAAVGDYVEVSGAGFHDSEVELVLITPQQRANFGIEVIEGNLFSLGRAKTEAGAFRVSVAIPATVASQNGKTMLTVMPGEYNLGARERNHASSAGPLTVTER